jgi:hypothetical protein
MNLIYGQPVVASVPERKSNENNLGKIVEKKCHQQEVVV